MLKKDFLDLVHPHIKEGHTYDHLGTEISTNKFKAEFICKIHGSYIQRSDVHIYTGCKTCNRLQQKAIYDKQWKDDCTIIHKGKYDYSDTVVGDVLKHSVIKCNQCKNLFSQTPASHKSGRGCPSCLRIQAGLSRRKDLKTIEKVCRKYGHRFDFSKAVYNGIKEKIEVICDKGHTFFKAPDCLINKKVGCPVCSRGRNRSLGEVELFNEINKYYNCASNDRKTIGKEMDIFIPRIKVGIEYNGLYWHSVENVGKGAQKDKTKLANTQNIHLIHVYENEWTYRRNIVIRELQDSLRIKPFGMIRHLEPVFENLSYEEGINIYEENALDPKSKIDRFIGLYHRWELIAIAALKPYKEGEVVVDLLRVVDDVSFEYISIFHEYLQRFKNMYIMYSRDWLKHLNLDSKYLEGTVESPKRTVKNNKILPFSESIVDEVESKTIYKSGYYLFKIS
jgi:hypothetical protein